MSQQRGFTLIELLVAIGLFAMVSVMAVLGLQNMTLSQQALHDSSAELVAAQFAFGLLDRDVRHAIARPVRDQLGDEQPALSGDRLSMALTLQQGRDAAWARTQTLQRVEYRLQNGQLIRRRWPVLDRTPGSEPIDDVLIEGVQRMSVRFLDQDRQWQQQWPPVAQTDRAQRLLAWPRAIELSLSVTSLGELSRLLPLPALPAPDRATVVPGS